MSGSLSKSQIDRLGLRLVGVEGPAEEDLGLLRQILIARSEQLDRAEELVRDRLGIVPTSRVKNTETILEKLRRGGGSGLKSIQDLAGMRIVGDFDRHGQDDLVKRIVGLFADGDRPPRVVDRRLDPMHGYRAVHVIVFPEGDPLEIQVRTRWQHEWAEFFEKLADLVGRGIRYGEPPAKRVAIAGVASTNPGALEQAEHQARVILVSMAHTAAELIAVLEAAEAERPGDPKVAEYRRDMANVLADLNGRLADLRRYEDEIRPRSSP